MTADKFAAKGLTDVGIAGHIVSAFSVAPHSPNVIVTSELVAVVLTPIDVPTVDAISKITGLRLTNVTKLARMIGERIYPDRNRQVVYPSKFLGSQCTQTFFGPQEKTPLHKLDAVALFASMIL
jgi:hypothetical protein